MGKEQQGEIREPDKKDPIYWTRLELVTPEVFNTVVDIFGIAYRRRIENRPSYEDFVSGIRSAGFVDWKLTSKDRFEARRLMDMYDQYWVRFTTNGISQSNMALKRSDPEVSFRAGVDEYLKKIGASTLLEDIRLKGVYL
jgi:hypothetical protein